MCMVSKDLVYFLGLFTCSHPEPQYMEQLNNAGKLEITHKCVSFSVGDYID